MSDSGLLGLAYAVSGTAVEVYHTDGLGSVRALTNASGAVSATYRTDEYGLPTAGTGSSSQPFGFTGEPRDATGLTYLRARYYDPSLGRFLSRDTWPGGPNAPQTQNRYAYANNNPTTNTDPSGHFVDTILDIGFIFFDLGSLLFGPPKERASNWLALGADIGAAGIPFVTGAGLITRGARAATKAINLPGWRGVAVDMVHIIETQGPGVVLGNKTHFPAYVSEQAIEAAVREAYRLGAKAGAIESSSARAVPSGCHANPTRPRKWMSRESGHRARRARPQRTGTPLRPRMQRRATPAERRRRGGHD